MKEKIEISPKYYDLIDEITRWYKKYLDTTDCIECAVMDHIDWRWLQASEDEKGFRLNENDLSYLNDAVETGIANPEDCPSDLVGLRELREYLEQILYKK